MPRCAPSLAALLATACLAPAARADQDLSGTWTGDGLTLRLTAAPGGYQGQVARDGQTWPLQAREAADCLRGAFQAGGSSFALTIAREGAGLRLETGGATYRLTRAGAPANAGSVVFVRHTLKDPGMGGMPSHTLLAPRGWTVEGGAWWAPQEYYNVLPNRDIKVRAPDGREVHLAPSLTARDFTPDPRLGMQRPREGAADGGYPVLYMPGSLEEWTRWLVTQGQRTYPQATGLRVTNATVVPELTEQLRRTLEPIRQMIAERQALDRSVGMSSFVDANVLAFELRYQDGGREWEELVVFGTTFQGFDTQGVGRQLSWTIDPAVTYRAPAGQLEASMPILLAIVNSVQLTPQWAQMRAELQAKLAGIALEGARKTNQAIMERSRIMSRTNAEINEIITKGWEQRQAIQDETHRKVIHSIRGTEDYQVAGGAERVELPGGYQHVYSNGNGEYLLTNDALYDPNTDPQRNAFQWQTMQPRR